MLVHGSMDRSVGMTRLARRLHGDHFVLRYDRRGYGRSARVGPPYGVADHVADLAGLITDVFGDGATRRSAALVFGHSFGGHVALGLADRHPELVDTVAVYESPLSWLDWWPSNSAGGRALATRDATDDPADAAEAFMRRVVGDDVWERLPASTRAARRAEGRAMVEELIDLRTVVPWDPSRIGAPLLVMCGGQARTHHRDGARLLADMVDGARFEMLTGAGHSAPLTHSAELATLLRRFVSSFAD